MADQLIRNCFCKNNCNLSIGHWKYFSYAKHFFNYIYNVLVSPKLWNCTTYENTFSNSIAKCFSSEYIFAYTIYRTQFDLSHANKTYNLLFRNINFAIISTQYGQNSLFSTLI